MHEEEDDIQDEAARRRALQELKRRIIQKVQASEDDVLLESVFEMIEDAEGDFMDGNKDPEEVEAAEQDYERPGNRKRPPPIHQKYKNDAESWLEGLGRQD
jgi:hypothetical protein